MVPGESVRVCYVAATRMVNVVWRGRSLSVFALPATADIAHMRFGVSLGKGNSMRLTGASAGTSCAHACTARIIAAYISAHYLEPHVRFVVLTRMLCQAGRAHAAGWLFERAPLWAVVHVCTLLRAY